MATLNERRTSSAHRSVYMSWWRGTSILGFLYWIQAQIHFELAFPSSAPEEPNMSHHRQKPHEDQLYIAEATKSIQKQRYPSEDVSVIYDLDTVSWCWQGVNELQTGGFRASVTTTGHRTAQRLRKKKRMLRDFLPMKRVLARWRNPKQLWLSNSVE